mmetsp:Transcript_120913/g.341958  ORF Transcript_120913/g.341958 Transcript_120913/m.341958 type:complete len:524 (-) Transcript_120913:81-1652(-)
MYRPAILPLTRCLGVGGVRSHSTTLPTPNIVVPDVARAAALTSNRAEDILRRAESRIRAEYEELRNERLRSQQGAEVATQSEATRDADAQGSVDEITDILQCLASDDVESQLAAAVRCRTLLSTEEAAPISKIVAAGAVVQLAQVLSQAQRTDLQFEVAWALTNIAAGTAEQTRAVVDCGAVPALARLLESPLEELREQAVWAIGNIAGDSPELRDLALQSGVLGPIAAMASQGLTMETRQRSGHSPLGRLALWALANLCRGAPPPALERVSPAVTALAQAVRSEDEEALVDVCWAFSYLCSASHAHIAAVLESGVCRGLVELLGHSSSKVRAPALRAIGNIAAGSDDQAQVLLQDGVLFALAALLESPEELTLKNACWALSNLTAGNPSQIQEVIDSSVVPTVVGLLRSGSPDVRAEAAWVVSNAISGGSLRHIEHFAENGCVAALVGLLDNSNPKMSALALKAIGNILDAGKWLQRERFLPDNPFATALRQAGGTQKLRALRARASIEEESLWVARILDDL